MSWSVSTLSRVDASHPPSAAVSAHAASVRRGHAATASPKRRKARSERVPIRARYAVTTFFAMREPISQIGPGKRWAASSTASNEVRKRSQSALVITSDGMSLITSM